MGNSLPNHQEDHIVVKGDNSLSHYNLIHKSIAMPQVKKNTGCKGSSGERMGKTGAKAAVDKEWEKLEKIPAWQLTEVRNKRGDR